MEKTRWCRMYFKIESNTFYKQLENQKFHTEFVSIESKADDYDKDVVILPIRHQGTGERGNPICLILQVSLREHVRETNNALLERCSLQAFMEVEKWMKVNYKDLPPS